MLQNRFRSNFWVNLAPKDLTDFGLFRYYMDQALSRDFLGVTIGILIQTTIFTGLGADRYTMVTPKKSLINVAG